MTSRETSPLLPIAIAGEAERPLGDRLFTIGWGAIQWPWLARSLSGGRPRDKAMLLAELDLPPDALPHLGSWKADTHLLRLLASHIRQHRPAQVVELGAGASTLVLARALAMAGGGKLLSFDQHPEFVTATRQWLHSHGLDADLRATAMAPPPRPWRGLWYALPHDLPAVIDSLIIDGPPWSNHPFVRGAAETLFPRIPIGGHVFLDDAARPGERVIAARWRQRWPNWSFQRDTGGTKGTLIGVRLT